MAPRAQSILHAAPARRRRGRLRLWKGIAAVAVLLALAAWVRGLRAEVEAGGFTLIATDRARLDTGPGWVDPRWHEELGQLLAALEDVSADDRAAVELLARRVAELSFVESIGVPTVLWPDGLRLELALREPVACVHVGRHFLPLAADGTLISGRWPAPPERDTGYLPVIELPPASELEAPRHLIPGAVLSETAAVDALAVAASLWRTLTPAEVARLGRCVIDARRARFASVEDPGTLLRLEGRRTVWFGRSPNLDEPGELPVASKWAHLARALALLEADQRRAEHPEGLDWDLVDVRWDRADLHPRAPEPEEG